MLSNLIVVIQDIIYLKDEIYAKSLGEYKSMATLWLILYENGDNVTYFNSFEVEPIPKEIKIFITNKNMNICGHCCIGFIDFMLNKKRLTDLTNLSFQNNLKENH